MSDIASGLNVDANCASPYRLRLIATELIEPSGHGRVDFMVPFIDIATGRFEIEGCGQAQVGSPGPGLAS